MADVYLGRINRGIEKLFNVKGGPTTVDVEPSVRFTFDTVLGLEERYLFGVETFAVAGAQAGVAGNKSACMIRNPLGSGIVLVMEKIVVSSTVAEQFNLQVAGSNPADLLTLQTSHNRADPRGRSVGTAIISNDAPAVDPGTGFLLEGIDFGTRIEWILYPNQEIILLPQIALRVIGQTLNQNLLYTFFWRERPLESSELT